MTSPIPWVGGKTSMLWAIDSMAPAQYNCFVDAFGGSGTVTLNRPRRTGCIEVYNDVNDNLVNLFRCIRDQPLALTRELGFLPLHSRTEFEAFVRFLRQEEIPKDHLQEEIEIAMESFPPGEGRIICEILRERFENAEVKRAAAYFRALRESFNAGGKVFAAKSIDITRFTHLIWDCWRRMKDVIIEHRDFEPLTAQYDSATTFLYYDPPYYEAERCYEALFTLDDHIRLHNAVNRCEGYVMVSYNNCDFVRELYQDFMIFQTTRANSQSHKKDAVYEELIMTNYDPSDFAAQTSLFGPMGTERKELKLIHKPETLLKTK